MLPLCHRGEGGVCKALTVNEPCTRILPQFRVEKMLNWCQDQRLGSSRSYPLWTIADLDGRNDPSSCLQDKSYYSADLVSPGSDKYCTLQEPATELQVVVFPVHSRANFRSSAHVVELCAAVEVTFVHISTSKMMSLLQNTKRVIQVSKQIHGSLLT